MSGDRESESSAAGAAIGAVIEGFEPPPPETFRWMVGPLRTWFAPKFFGLEYAHPAKPALWVGNHTIYGLIDVSVLATELYLQKGVFLRGLGDRAHFQLPLWRDTLSRFGVVLGTRENCDRLMQQRQHVIVFPGGGREVFRRKNERYKLMWKNRTGFARMAIRHGYPILPFAQVGADDAFDILVDADDVMRSPLGTVLERTGIAGQFLRGGETIFPLARGLGLTVIPRPERFYFSVCAPIDTREYAGRENDDVAVFELRDRVRDTVRDEIVRLRQYRKTDREVSIFRRLINRFG